MRVLRHSLEATRAGYGSLQVTVPNLLATRLLAAPLTPVERRAARVLGARHVVQAAATAALPTPAAYRLGAGVDGLHALSMVALAAADASRRRIAVAEAVSAGVFAVAGLCVARALSGPRRGRKGRRR
ncbi:hypothetical protein [Actinopolymorpha pittospori]